MLLGTSIRLHQAMCGLPGVIRLQLPVSLATLVMAYGNYSPAHLEDCSWPFPTAMVPNLGPPEVLGLQLPEIMASRASGEGL